MTILNHRIGVIFIALVIIFLSFAAPSFAEKVTFVKEYTYQASELDSKASCRTISLEMVKRLLLEELGTYLISETEVKDFKLTKEQVKTYSAGIVGAEVIDDKWDGKTYWLKAKVSADPKEVSKSLKKIMDDPFKGKELEETRKKAEELTKENERLRKELELVKKSGSKDEKAEAKKIKKYEKTINGLNAVAWFEKASAAITVSNYQQAINDFSKAIELDPDFYRAVYIVRGLSYGMLDNHQQAIKDFTKAIELDPKSAEAYNNRGRVYGFLGNNQQAINDFNKAIELKPDVAMAYSARGSSYADLGDYQQAIKDYTKVIELKPDVAMAYMVYHNRGFAYGRIGNYQQAIKDYTKAIELKPDYAEAYAGRGIAYGRLGPNQQAVNDFKIAARLGYKPAQDFLREMGISW